MALNGLKSTDVTIHNKATGSLQFVKSRSTVISWPKEILPGQSAKVKDSGPVGAVVYSFKNPAGTDCDWMMSWSNKYGDTSRKVYTEIKEPGHYDNDDVWVEILIKLEHSTNHSEAHWEDCSATVDGNKHAVHGEFRTNKVST